MNFKIVLLLSVLFIISVYGKSIRKSMNIPDITAHCSKLVKNLNVKGIDAYVPTKKEAKESMGELRKILKISAIKDEKEKRAKFADHPELKNLSEKLKKIKRIQSMSEKEQERTLKTNEDMLETVVRLSMLDTTNRKSPIYGRNISKLLGNSKDNLRAKAESAKNAAKICAKSSGGKVAKSMKRKYHKKDGNMRFLFSKVIQPGHRMPDSNKIRYTDEKGRDCFCAC